jgi:hypothetical protein
MTISTGISPKIDESIHSFFLRVIIRTGWEDFTTIITHGGWGNTPSIPYELRCETNSYDRRHLFELFERQFYVGRKLSLFDNVFLHTRLFREAFFPDKKKSSCGSIVPLRFCYCCIEAQLVEQGFSYFKLDWLNAISCNVHLVPLHKIRNDLSFSKTRDTLKSIIFAEWNKIRDLVSAEVSHPTVVGKESSYNDVKKMLAISFTDCAKRDLIGYFMKLTDYYPSGLFSVADYGLLSKQDRYFLSMKKRMAFLKEQLEDAYNYELEDNYSSFMEHCNNFIEHKRVVCFGIERYVMKSKRQQCLDCLMNNPIDSRSCLAAGVISYPARVFPKQENICDKFLHDIERGVESYQKRLKVDYGERFVRGAIERSREIHASGGLDSYRKERESRLKQAAEALVDLT